MPYPWSNFDTLTADDLNAAFAARAVLPDNVVFLGTDGAGNPVSNASVAFPGTAGVLVDETYNVYGGGRQNQIEMWMNYSYPANGSGGLVINTLWFPGNFPTTANFLMVTVEGTWDAAAGSCGYWVSGSDLQTYVNVAVWNAYGTETVNIKLLAKGY